MNAAKRTPAITLILIAANIAAAFLLVLQPELLNTFGFVSARPTFVTVLAGLFLHANLLHLLGNMVFLAAAGPATEATVGSIRFFGVYLSGGVVGVLFHWVMAPTATAPLIGASGAVAACVALGAVRFYRTKVPLAPGLSVPVVGVALTWLLLQVLGGMFKLGMDQGGTAYWAHVGGALTGLLLALAFRTNAEADRVASHEVIAEMNERGPAAALAAAELHLSSHPNDLKALVEQAEALVQLGEKGRASQAFRTALEICPDADQPPLLERAAQCDCLGAIPSLRRTLLAERIRGQHGDLARLLLESVVGGPANDGQRPDAMLALAEIRRDSDPAGAAQLVQELFQAYPLHPASELARAKGWAP